MIPLRYNLRSLAVRKTTTFATAFGIALVVFVLASALMLSAGVRKTMRTSGHPDVAIVMRKGSDNELSSTVESASINVIAAAPGAKASTPDLPSSSPELVIVAAIEKLGASGVTNVQLRGVPEHGMRFRPEMRIIAGRAPAPGQDEVMIGARLRGRFRGLDLGQSFEIRKNRQARVVGVFEAGGTSHDSEVWMDLDLLRTSFSRQGYVSSVRVRLSSPAAFDAFRAAIEGEKRFGFMALREAEFYEKQSEGTSIFISAIGSIVSVFFAIGAMIGAMITMYGAVANRQREIGTLRAIGFSRRAILLSFLLESTSLALIGGAVGVAGAMAMGFVKISMMNFQSWSEMVFTFDPTPQVILTAFTFAASMGLLGGFLPAIRAARTSPVEAMRGG
ncbi:MAG: ABC transporter permease [Deltaproteobacteria bacterium]|nr:ABC transporter permease [Deltaproteobacteria bacterium]